MKYFGTDGIRNKGDFFLNNSFAYKVGRSLSLLYNKNLYIGYDTRCSSSSICHLLISGALSSGLNIYNLQMTSTPCIAYYSLLNNAIGVSITASHNKYTDNGIKIFINGRKINDEEIKLIEDYIDNYNYLDYNNYINYNYGTIQNKCPLEYISFLNQFKTDTSNVLIDTANGATSNISKYFFKNIINNTPNGININENCGSTNISNIIKYTKDSFDYGISLDGDGDRLIIVDRNGFIYSGDMLVYVLCKIYKIDNAVLTKMCNPGIINLFNDNNILLKFSDIGDSNVYRIMNKFDISIGGEDSGHIINKHLLPFGDGLLNALVILKYINEHNIRLNELINPLIKYPEVLINYNNINDNKIKMIKNIENNYIGNPDFKLLFRKSGTEDLYRLYISYKDVDVLNKLIEDINNE